MDAAGDARRPVPARRGWTTEAWRSGGDHRFLEVRSLVARRQHAPGDALRDVDLALDRGSRLAVIGDAGSGKTTLLLAMMQLLPETATVAGSIRLDGRELLGAHERELRTVRGRVVAIVFGDGERALNPTMGVGAQVSESLRAHRRRSRRETREVVATLFERVGLDPELATSRPHLLSAEQRQRVLLASALASSPELLLVDDLGSGLRTDQRRALWALLGAIQAADGFAMIAAGRELSEMAPYVDEVAVLVAGSILEQADTATITDAAVVPATLHLLRGSSPRSEPGWETAEVPRRGGWWSPSSGRFAFGRLFPAPGPTRRAGSGRPESAGCGFAPYCPQAVARCSQAVPPLKEYSFGHRWACWNPLQPAARGD